MASGFEQVGVEAVVQGVGQYVSNANQVASATQGINRSTQQAEGSSTSYGRSLTTLGSQMRTAGTNAIFLGGALAAPGIAALKVALNYDTAITKISTLSGVAQEDLGQLREGIAQISSTTAQGPQELADALLAITSTGLRGAAALDVLNSSAKASALGLGETETLGRLLTSTLKAYEKQGLTAARATDILFATVREGGADAAELSGALGRVTGIAATFGISFEQVGAFIATLTRVIPSADEAVTALRGTITALSGDSKQTEQALEGVGLSSAQLRDILKNQGLLAVLETLVVKFKDNTAGIQDVIPNVRALAGVLGTAGSQAQGYQTVLEAVTNSQDDFNKAFAQLQETPGFAVQQSIADLQSALINLGANGLPVLVTFVNILSGLIEKFTELPEPIQSLVLAFSVIGGGLIAFGGAATVLIGTLTSLAGALTSVGGALGLSGAAVATGPVGLALLATAVVGAGVAYLFMRDKISEANDKQRESKEIAEATALAQKGSTTEIASRVTSLQTTIAIEEAQIATLDALKNKTVEQSVQERELKKALQENRAELATQKDAQEILRIARDQSSKSIQGVIDDIARQTAAWEHEIEIDKEVLRQGGITDAQRRATIADIERLNGQIDSQGIFLARLKAALGIATDAEKALAAAAAAQGNAVAGAGASASNASKGIFDLGAQAGATVKDLAHLTVEAAATAAALQIIQRIGEGPGHGLLGFLDVASDIAGIIQGARNAVMQAEQIRALIGGISTDLTHSIGQQTDAEKAAAKSAGSAADDAASAAKKAAEDAQKALEDLAAKAKQVAEEASRNATKIAEDAAAAAVKAAEDAAAAYAKIIQGEISSLDQLGGLITTALRRQAQETLNAATTAISAERKARTDASSATIKTLGDQRDAAIKAANDTRDATIDSIETTRDAQLQALQDQTDARVAALNAQLGILDEQSVAEQRAELQRNLALAFDPAERAAAQKAITDFERQQQQKAIRDQISAVQDAAKVQEKTIKDSSDDAIKHANDTRDSRIEDAKLAADAAIENEKRALDSATAALDAQQAAAQATYAALTDEWALQSAARVLVMGGEIDKIGALLDAFVPEWRAAGMSFGEAIKNGLRASNVADFIQKTLSGVPDANGVTPAEQDRAAQIAGLEALGTKLREGGAPQGAQDKVAQDIIDLGGVPQFNNSTVQANSRAAEIAARQQQGKDLKNAGAPEITLEDLRQSLIALGAIPEFRRGLDMGMIRRPMLASLDPGEVVLNREQQGQMGGVTIAAGAFAGMFSGATFGGDANETGRAIRSQLEAMFQDLGRGSHLAGWR